MSTAEPSANRRGRTKIVQRDSPAPLETGHHIMPDTDTIFRLFKYKARANQEILTAMKHLDGAAPATEIAIRTLCHTHVVDQIFAAHMTGRSHTYTSANLSRAPALEELSQAISTSDQWYLDYVPTLDREQLAERIDFNFTDGAPGRMSREEMLMHVIMHGNYHWGQIGWIMTLEGVTPALDGFTTYLHQTEASARRRLDAPNGAPDAALAEPERGETPAEEAKPQTRLETLTERMRTAVSAGASLGKTLKFDLKGEGFVFIDGNTVTNEDKPADLTLSITIDDLRAIGQGKLAPMTAVMTRRLGLSDMGAALGLRDKLQTLFKTP
jgi:uncharacterized damage-inducible protein DinB/putative sterol carrier protein